MSFLYCQKGFLICSLEDLRNVTVLQYRFLHSCESTLKELRRKHIYAGALNGFRDSLQSKIIVNMLDFANVHEHHNISVCCVRLQLSKLSFRAFSPSTIFGVQRFYPIKTIAFTQCLHWLIVSGFVAPNLGQPTLILITELFALVWTECLFLWAEHSAFVWFS